MMWPSSGGRNQRERTSSDSFWRTSRSLMAPSMPVLAAPHRNGFRNHLLQTPALVSGESSTVTSALSSQRSRMRFHAQIVAERARQHGADDAAGGGAGDDVDHDAQLHRAPDLAQQIEIDLLGVVFGIAAVEPVEERCFQPLRAVGNPVQRARGAHELEDFLADAVHIDGERHAAEAHERNAKLLLAQGGTPGQGDSRTCSDHVGRWRGAEARPYSIAVADSIHTGA